MRRRSKPTPLKVIKKNNPNWRESKLMIRCPITDKYQPMRCGKDRCKWFLRRIGDVVYCTHPEAKNYVYESDTERRIVRDV